ncbi:uncharacterized protein LOC115033371 isoform X2 [Acyrthosiphon pisum]|uniref:Uncharacterized protein n=1 Tax=Acyrthosiphon pisum TaxID=7029 RepID=A0A8R2JLT1_ACYPI|nr:uncharacterized protein LOC115033371 isoform X2 [Acyrthosiphon pisum]
MVKNINIILAIFLMLNCIGFIYARDNTELCQGQLYQAGFIFMNDREPVQLDAVSVANRFEAIGKYTFIIYTNIFDNFKVHVIAVDIIIYFIIMFTGFQHRYR